MSHTAVFGIFKDRLGAEGAVTELKNGGFRADDISALLPDKQSTKDFAHEKATKAPEGATTGAASGLVVGGALGWLVGIGSLAIPGVGPFIAAGPIMAALAGAGIGGAVGGLSGALIGMGIPEYEAKRYEGMINEGGVLVSAHCIDAAMVKRAKEILHRTGGEGIASTGEASAKAKENDGNVRSVSSDSMRDRAKKTETENFHV